MNNERIKFALLGAVIGGFVVWLFLGGMRPTGFGMMSNTQNSGGMMGEKMETIDAHFIEQMIPHHEDAIIMAKLALTNAKKPEVKQLAENVVKSQGEEITQMKSWYQDWFNKEVPASTEGMMGKSNGMHGGMMGDESDMKNLEEAIDFDKAFVEEMIPHHQMAVMMATMLKSGSKKPEMTQLADDIIAAQNSEINQMREWLKSW